MAAVSIDQDGEKTSYTASNVEQLLDQCSRHINAAAIAYAEAGMGGGGNYSSSPHYPLLAGGTSQVVKGFDHVFLMAVPAHAWYKAIH